MKNYVTTFEGPKNNWTNGYTQWFSFSLETGFTGKKLVLLGSHLWLFGFQIFEFSLKRKRGA